MSTGHWIHDLIKAQIALKTANSTENKALLDDIKEFFKDEIGSARRFACINTFQDLLEILESRATFEEKEICTAMDNIQMNENENKNEMEPDSNKHELISIDLYESDREKLYGFIASMIDENWYEFGKQLQMSDECLEELGLSSDYDSNEEKIKKLLEMFESNEFNDGHKIVHGICIALRECNCSEIGQYAQDLFSS